MRLPKLVLTGGPCAGKTSCLKAIEKTLAGRVATVSEAATVVLSGGWGKEREFLKCVEQRALFQGEILRTQLELESRWEIAVQGAVQAVLCDRGLLDGCAYWPEGREAYLEHFALTLEDCFSRYDVVIHLESLATANPARYSADGNDQRYEDLHAAIQCEQAVRDAWRGHPRWVFIGGDEIEQKVARMLDVVQEFLR